MGLQALEIATNDRALREEQIDSLAVAILEALLPDAIDSAAHVGQDLLAPLEDLEQRPRARARLHIDVEEDSVELLLPARDQSRGGRAQRNKDAEEACHACFCWCLSFAAAIFR